MSEKLTAARSSKGSTLAETGSNPVQTNVFAWSDRFVQRHIGPNAADTHNDLAQELALTGRHDEALAEFGEAMRLRDGWAPPMSGAALILATHPDPKIRDPEQAVQLARRAAHLTSQKDQGVLEILAGCYAAADKLDEAVAAQKAAVELAAATGDPTQARAVLATYERRLGR